jgi:uroporphyrinogen decarboxylase
MNHRERVRAAIRHQMPDRVPMDLGGMRSTGILAIAYDRLKRHLGIDEGELLVFDTMQQLAYVEPSVRAHFGADVLILDLGLVQGWRNYLLPDGTPAKITSTFRTESDGEGGEYALDQDNRRAFHRPAASYYFDRVYHPLAEATSVSDLDRYQLPSLKDHELHLLAQEARRLYNETDYAILGTFGGAFLEGAQELRGWDVFMMDLASDVPFAEALLDRMLTHYLREVDRYLDAVGDYIDIIQMGGDMGMQNGPQIRPGMYNKLFQPREKALWGHIHRRNPNVAVFLHCCGGIYELLPGIIDAGIDILNPVQFSARGMEPERLKREFGDRICFWGGGCDTQRVLPRGAPEEVYAHTRQMINIFKPGGGFVFCPVHNIQVGVPPENIVAMYQALQHSWAY